MAKPDRRTVRDTLTEEQIQREHALSKDLLSDVAPPGSFNCTFCHKELPERMRSKEKPSKCVYCQGDGSTR